MRLSSTGPESTLPTFMFMSGAEEGGDMSPLPSAGTSFLSPSLTEVTHPSGERATPRGDDSLAMRARTTPPGSLTVSMTTTLECAAREPILSLLRALPARTTSFPVVCTMRGMLLAAAGAAVDDGEERRRASGGRSTRV